MTRLSIALFAIIALSGCAHDPRSAMAPASSRYLQDDFVIGFWVDPPAGQDWDVRYREIADAHFSLVLGGFGAKTPETTTDQLRLCRKYGMKALVYAGATEPRDLPDGPVCEGYAVRDEPNASDFPALAERVAALRQAHPGKLAYINLFPNYASSKQLGTDTYEDYVRRFVDEVDVDVLSMDHYPFMTPEKDTRDAYCANLDVMRRVSLENHIPFWNFFNIMPFGPHYDPTEAQVRWQIFTSLAYGAKGVLYFCYWTPRGAEFPKGGAIITADGRRTRHYGQARRINRVVENLGPTLMELTSERVVRITPASEMSGLKDTPLQAISPGDYLIGVYSHPSGARAVLINNYSDAYTAWPTVEFAGSTVQEVSPETGRLVPVVDDSPDMDGMQLSLDAGEGRLFLVR